MWKPWSLARLVTCGEAMAWGRAKMNTQPGTTRSTHARSIARERKSRKQVEDAWNTKYRFGLG